MMLRKNERAKRKKKVERVYHDWKDGVKSVKTHHKDTKKPKRKKPL